jgi:hypothetical protein
MDMPSDFYEQQQPPSVKDMNGNGESQPSLSRDQIRAGTKVVMNHAQRQAFLKTSPLGQVFGVADLLPEVEQVTQEAPKEYSRSKRVKILLAIARTKGNVNRPQLRRCLVHRTSQG